MVWQPFEFIIVGGAASRVKLVGNDRDLFWCDVGQEDGAIVLRVDHFIDQDQEFIDDVLAR